MASLTRPIAHLTEMTTATALVVGTIRQRSFRDLAPSAEAWLTTWVESRTQKGQTADLMAAAQVNLARQARAKIAAMTPQGRAKMGLPEVGWERVVRGGIGLDEDET